MHEVYGVTFRVPVYNYMTNTFEISLFLHYLTPFEHCSSLLVF